MLFQGKMEDQRYALLRLLDIFVDGYNLETNEVEGLHLDSEKIDSIIYYINDKKKFPHCDGLVSASAFKKVAYFTVVFIRYAPIEAVIFTDDQDEYYAFKHVLKDYNPNVVFAVTAAITMLNSHVLQTKTVRYTNHKKIALSRHSYEDILDALHTLENDLSVDALISHWHLVALLFEQIFYKTNPECQYDDFVFGTEEYATEVNSLKRQLDYSEMAPEEQ